MVKVIIAKYTKGVNVNYWKCPQNSSGIWRSIMKTHPFVLKGIRWNIGKGDKVNLWNDWWYGRGSLNSCFNKNVDSNLTVQSIINNNSWDFEDPGNELTDDIKEVIRTVHLPRHHSCEDLPTWGHGINGRFSIKSAYNFCLNPTPGPILLGLGCGN